MARRTLMSFVALAAFAAFPFACGGRNLNAFLLTDNAEDDGAGADDGSGGFGGGNGRGGDGVGGDGGRPGPGGPGSGPSTGPGGIQECIGCAASECPGAVECFTDPDCQAGLACGITECVGGGGSPDPVCFLECFDGDVDAAFQAFEALTCVFMNCQDECAGLLSGGFPGGP